jgi:hypothetical protein
VEAVVLVHATPLGLRVLPIAVTAELGPMRLPGLGGAADQTAPRVESRRSGR